MIDLPTAPNHIVVNIKPEHEITWPQHLNLAPGSNVIRIAIGLTTRCDKKVKIGPQESVAYYSHAVNLAFAVTVWKCQGRTYEYIIALLEGTPGSPALTFEKIYVMFTRLRKASHFPCLPLSRMYNKRTLFHLCPKILATKWRMDIDKHGYWKPHASNTSSLSQPKISRAVAARKT